MKIVNEFYRKALRLIIDDDSGNDLLYLSQHQEEFEQAHEKCFHEISCDDDGQYTVLNDTTENFNFCKTAHKLYDPVIVLAYTMLAHTKLYTFSSDGDVSMFNLDTKDKLALSLKEYLSIESSNPDAYDIQELVNLFYIYDGCMTKPYTIEEEEADTGYKFKIGDVVNTFDGFTAKILRLENNNNYKLKGLRKYYHETMLTSIEDTGSTIEDTDFIHTIIVGTDCLKFHALADLSNDDKGFIADKIYEGVCQIKLPNSNLILEINLISTHE